MRSRNGNFLKFQCPLPTISEYCFTEKVMEGVETENIAAL